MTNAKKYYSGVRKAYDDGRAMWLRDCAKKRDEMIVLANGNQALIDAANQFYADEESGNI
jgi:hypothetical protein